MNFCSQRKLFAVGYWLLAIGEALTLAATTLIKERMLLLKLSGTLSDNRMLTKDQIKQMTQQTMPAPWKDKLRYRDIVEKIAGELVQGVERPSYLKRP